MTQLRQQSALWLQFGAFLLIWILLILIKGYQLNIDSRALGLLPTAIGIYAILYVLFVKWAWRWRLFGNWLVVIPDLQGTWKGELQTTWVNPETGQIPPPIEFVLTVRQTLYHVHIRIFTQESESKSESAALHIDEANGTTVLAYSYTNVPDSRVRYRSEIHFGAARLSLIKHPVLQLVGDYWTDRKSTGHMRADFLSRALIDTFTQSSYPESES